MKKPRRGPVPDPASVRGRLGNRSAVLIGMMGAGKSSVGRRLAARLGLPFVDADAEIEAAAGCSIAEIFARHGEQHFRDGERKVIARLLDGGPQVLATGGGAWMNEQTRETVARAGVSIWLRADLDVLLRRVKRRDDRPLLRGDNVEDSLRRLLDERHPTYARADVTVRSRDVPHDVVVDDILVALERSGAIGPVAPDPVAPDPVATDPAGPDPAGPDADMQPDTDTERTPR